jgi:uncharacterized membrane protein YfcA
VPAGEIAILAALAFVGALIFGTTGFGGALVAVPLATHLEPLQFALALYVLVDLGNALSVGLENPRKAVRAELKWLLPAILAGTAIAATVLVNLPRRASMGALGVFIVCYAIYALVRREGQGRIAPFWAWPAGLIGGITSTLFGSGGPAYVIYLSQRGMEKEPFRATLGLAILFSISMREVAFFLTGLLLDARVWIAAIFVVPSALLGIHVARRIFLRISREMLMRAIAVLLLASGGSLIYRALGF